MLIKATQKHRDIIAEFCKNNILGARISCLVNCYSFDYDFFNVMLCLNQNDELSCVIASFDENVTVHAKNSFNSEEVLQYLKMISFKSLTAERVVMDKLGFSKYEQKTAYRFFGKTADYPANNANENDYKEIYHLISKAIPGSFSEKKEAYLSWLSDFTFRRKRNSARMKCIKEENELICCAMTSAECENDAIISGVACDENKRKKGAGKAIVLSVTNELIKENKNVFVIALNASAQGFYEHIGFEKECVIAIAER